MDLLGYWKAGTSENSAEKCIRGITGEQNYKRIYNKLCSHRSWEDTEICCLDYDCSFWHSRMCHLLKPIMRHA